MIPAIPNPTPAPQPAQTPPQSSGGTVTKITAGPGLSGGVITNTGTVSLAAIAASSLMGNPGSAIYRSLRVQIAAAVNVAAVDAVNVQAGWPANP